MKTDSEEVRKALEDPIAQIIAAVRDTLDRTPSELDGDVMERGMTFAGGGALVPGNGRAHDKQCRCPPGSPTHDELRRDPVGQALEEFEVTSRDSRRR